MIAAEPHKGEVSPFGAEAPTPSTNYSSINTNLEEYFMTDNNKIRDIAFDLPTDKKLKIGDKEVEVKPMNFDSQLLFMKKIGKPLQQLIKNSMDDTEEESLSSLLLAIKDIALNSLDFEWLQILPDTTKVVTDFYELNLDITDIKKLGIQKMLEIIITQYECEKTTNEVASSFFTQLTRKIPGLDQLLTLTEITGDLMTIYNTRNSLNYTSSTNSLNDTDATPENLQKTTAGAES